MDTAVLKRFAQEAWIVLKSKVSSKIDVVLDKESAARRENAKAVRELESKIDITENVTGTHRNQCRCNSGREIQVYK